MKEHDEIHYDFQEFKQFAYTKHCSTTIPLMQVVDSWKLATDQKKYTVAVFLDLCNAFDVIDHLELLVKLKKYDFGEPEVNWVNSHLTKRQHYVVCDNDISYVQTLTSGVPPKSVLDLLSSVFISTLL